MLLKNLRYIMSLALALLTGCAIENDIPYPEVNGLITDIAVEGQRAAEGAMPGDALVLVATGAGGMPPVLVSDDPRIESLSAGLALAAEGWMRRRMREASPSRRILRIQGAASSEEVERAAAEIIRSLRAGAPVENLSAADLAARVWAGLLGARIEQLERTPLGVALSGRALLEKGALRADAGPGAWKDSEAPLVVRLGRGAADGLFWL